MSTIVVTLTVAPQEFPLGTEFFANRVTLTGAGGEAVQDTVGTEVTFNDVGPGDYIVSVVSLDQTGAVLAGPLSEPVRIAPTTVSLNVVIGLSSAVV